MRGSFAPASGRRLFRLLSAIPTALLLSVLHPADVRARIPTREVARGDALWETRARGAGEGWADPDLVADAVAAYENAWTEAPGSPKIAWRLARTLWFQAEYAVRDPDRGEEILDRATEIAEAGLTRLAAGVGGRERVQSASPEERAELLTGRPEAAPLYFWGAVSWGVWGEVSGKLAAARRGVGDRIRRYAKTVIAIDETFEHAGGHRVLGRLHAEAPKIPFFTGWVDRDRAIRELEEAHRRAPDHLFNPLYLAEALLQHRPEQTARAQSLLKAILEAEPDPTRRVEETRARIRARNLLED